VEPAGLLGEVARARQQTAGPAALRVALWLAGGAAVWLSLAERRHLVGLPRPDARLREAAVFLPLLLRPAITLLASRRGAAAPPTRTASRAGGSDPGTGDRQDAATLAACFAARLPVPRLPPRRSGEVFLLSFLAYAVLGRNGPAWRATRQRPKYWSGPCPATA